MPKFIFDEEKFIVVNTKRFNEMNNLHGSTHPAVIQFLRAIRDFNIAYENTTLKAMDQKYVVVNLDEPYAPEVVRIIAEGEENKEAPVIPYLDEVANGESN